MQGGVSATHGDNYVHLLDCPVNVERHCLHYNAFQGAMSCCMCGADQPWGGQRGRHGSPEGEGHGRSGHPGHPHRPCHAAGDKLHSTLCRGSWLLLQRCIDMKRACAAFTACHKSLIIYRFVCNAIRIDCGSGCLSSGNWHVAASGSLHYSARMTVFKFPLCGALQVLQDFQENPAAAQKHLKEPTIAAKLQKLVSAGIVRMA